MRTLAFSLAIVFVASGNLQMSMAQDAAQPAASQAQQDQEWLTAYMMAHQGYRLDHMDALEDSFSKMTPTQLGTLRDFYEQKHAANMRQQEMLQRAQDLQVSFGEANLKKQSQALNQFNQEESSAADLEDQRIATMHQEAAAYSQDKSMVSPYGFGIGYGSALGYGPYGGYPYHAGPGHPAVNPYRYGAGY